MKHIGLPTRLILQITILLFDICYLLFDFLLLRIYRCLVYVDELSALLDYFQNRRALYGVAVRVKTDVPGNIRTAEFCHGIFDSS